MREGEKERGKIAGGGSTDAEAVDVSFAEGAIATNTSPQEDTDGVNAS